MKQLFQLNCLKPENKLRRKSLHSTSHVLSSWSPNNGDYFAVAYQNKVSFYDPFGDQVAEIVTLEAKEPVMQLEWSPTCFPIESCEEYCYILAILQEKTTFVTLLTLIFERNKKKKSFIFQVHSEILDIGVSDIPTFLKWNHIREEPFLLYLAIGTKKGILALYNHHHTQAEQKEVSTILGKHSGEIVCGGFTDNQLLLLGSEDSSFTISDIKSGDTLLQKTLSTKTPKSIELVNNGDGGDSLVVLNAGNMELLVWDFILSANDMSIQIEERPLEIEYQISQKNNLTTIPCICSYSIIYPDSNRTPSITHVDDCISSKGVFILILYSNGVLRLLFIYKNEDIKGRNLQPEHDRLKKKKKKKKRDRDCSRANYYKEVSTYTLPCTNCAYYHMAYSLGKCAISGDKGVHILNIQLNDDGNDNQKDQIQDYAFIPYTDDKENHTENSGSENQTEPIGANDQTATISKEMKIASVHWSPNGQTLLVCEPSQKVSAYLIQVPNIHAMYTACDGSGRGTSKVSATFLSSIREITYVDVMDTHIQNNVATAHLKKEEERIKAITNKTIMHLPKNVGNIRRVAVCPFYLFVVVEESAENDIVLIYGLANTHSPCNSKQTHHNVNKNQKENSQNFQLIRRVKLDSDINKVRDICANEHYFAILLSTHIVELHSIKQDNEDGQELQQSKYPRRIPPTEHNDKERNTNFKVTCIAMTTHFLHYGTQDGRIVTFNLKDEAISSTYPHSTGIQNIFPNSPGTRLVIQDFENRVFLFNSVSYESTQFPEFPSDEKNLTEHPVEKQHFKALWDCDSKAKQNLIHLYDESNFHTYIYAPMTIEGSTLTKIGSIQVNSKTGEISISPQLFPLDPKLRPMFCIDGFIYCHSIVDGTLKNIPSPILNLDVTYTEVKHKKASVGLQEKFARNLALLRLDDAYQNASEIGGDEDKKCWIALGYKAIYLGDINMAINVHQLLGDVAMVMALEELIHLQDKNLLIGKLHLLLSTIQFAEGEKDHHYSRAQELFLASSRPITSLELRRSLGDWEEVFKLAKTFAPINELPNLSMDYANELELKGDYKHALSWYIKAMNELEDTEAEEGRREDKDSLLYLCKSGIAKCSLRTGNLSKGIRITKDLNNSSLYLKCAEILVSLEQLRDAAQLFKMEESVGMEKAFNIYIDLNDHASASRLIDKISVSPQLLSRYGSLCEQEGRYESSLRAYEEAGDLDSMIRLCIGPLNRLDKCISIVRSSGANFSSDAASAAIAKYCLEISSSQEKQNNCNRDHPAMVELLMILNQKVYAFDYAKKHNCVNIYTKFLGDQINSNDAEELAHYYESLNEVGESAKYYVHMGDLKFALTLFLQAGEKYISQAIDVVGRAKDENLTHLLIDFLMGETDGKPKDPEYVYQLYIALENFTEASNTAILISEQEQSSGNYDRAHSVIFNSIHHFNLHELRTPQKIKRLFNLFHSYKLAKLAVHRGDHEKAARLLLRIALKSNKFPNHELSIIISTIIECQKSGLKNEAYEWAVCLCSTNNNDLPGRKIKFSPSIYKDFHQSKFKKKIQAIVRHRPDTVPKKEEGEELEKEPHLTKCPISKELIPSYCLECPKTNSPIPMCICTGMHMIVEDWCFCPVSGMPAIYSKYCEYINREKKGVDNKICLDPVCGKEIKASALKKSKKKDVMKFLRIQYSV